MALFLLYFIFGWFQRMLIPLRILTMWITFSTTHRATRPTRHESPQTDSRRLCSSASGIFTNNNGVGRVATDQNVRLEIPDRWMVY